MSFESLLHAKPIWVIVADESKATVYSQDTRRSALAECDTFENLSARDKFDNLLSDSGGRSFDSHGHGRHTMTREKSDPKKQSAVAFAKKIAKHIVDARNNGNCRDFALIAAPRFLGLLREALPATPNAIPYLEISKEVVGQNKQEIQRLLERAQSNVES